MRRFLPSPAMVVAVIALVMSLSGGAYALVITGKSIKNGSITNKDVRNRTLTGNGASRFAVVNAGGQAVRGRDVSSAARTSEGRYQVIFSGDVRNCAYYATVGDESASAPPQNGQISVSSLGSNVNGVAVRTENGTNGTELDRPFHLLVMC